MINLKIKYHDENGNSYYTWFRLVDNDPCIKIKSISLIELSNTKEVKIFHNLSDISLEAIKSDEK